MYILQNLTYPISQLHTHTYQLIYSEYNTMTLKYSHLVNVRDNVLSDQQLMSTLYYGLDVFCPFLRRRP
jgi:hypothetical protein